MKPAYHIYLTAQEKRAIADITATMSQIDWMMRLTVQFLLEISPKTAMLIMGSTSTEANSNLWSAVVREKLKPHEAKDWVDYAMAEYRAVTSLRNSLVHALFGEASNTDDKTDLIFVFGHEPPRAHEREFRGAVKVKNAVEAPLTEIKDIRDRAARLSIIIAFIEFAAHPALPDDFPSFQRRLSPISRAQKKLLDQKKLQNTTKQKAPPQS